MASAPSSGSRRLVVRAAGRTLALDSAEVSEVVRAGRLTPVPLAPPALDGLASLRGRVVPVVSMARLLGEADADRAGARRLVVLRRADPIALAVDEVDATSGEAAEEFAGGAHLDDLLREAFAAARSPQARTMRPAAASQTRKSEAVVRRDVGILAFAVAGQAYGLPLSGVREVFRAPEAVLRLQDADSVALGVIPHRNGVLPVVSPAALLGLGQAAPSARPSIVVAALGPAAVGLLVDEVRAIARVAEDDLRPVPAVLNRGRGEAEVQAIARTADGLVAMLSPERLFDHQTVAAVLAATPAEAAPMTEATRSRTESFLIFRLGEESYGAPASAVIEVTPLPEALSPPPAATRTLAGVMNHRGVALPVIDPAARFGLERAVARGRRVVVLDIGGQRCGLVVDGVESLSRIEVDRLGETSELAEAGAKVFHRAAIVEVDGRPVLIVDPAALLDDAERRLLADLDAHAAGKA